MKNIILISLDCVRADVGYSKQFPTINKLCSKGISFLNTISSAPLTPVSHASVLTGLQPYNHGIRHLFKEKLNKNITTLQQIFRKKGYKTAAIVSCPGMNKWYGFGKGFDLYDDEIPKLSDGSDPLKTVDVKLRGIAMKRAEVVVEKAIKWVEKNKDQTFFLFLHFFDAHWPYKAPKKFRGKNNYENEVAYSDYYLGIFLKKLEELKLTPNTTIVCFSDHGEDLNGLYPNDKGGKKLGHPEEFGHGCLLYEQTQKVLFILNDKSIKKNRKIKQQVRLIDIFPTILDLFKIKTNITIDGVSLLPIIKNKKNLDLIGYSETFYPDELRKRNPDFRNVSCKKSIRIKNKYKIIMPLNSEKIEVYDLEKDPLEINNLYRGRSNEI